MTKTLEIPDGFVLVPKGGRPKKTLRDIAVFMAHFWKTEELGKGYLADLWIIDNFKLNESSDVRKCRKKAKQSLPETWLIIIDRPKTMLLLDAVVQTGGVPLPREGGSGWIWVPGLAEAAEVVARNCVATISPVATD